MKFILNGFLTFLLLFQLCIGQDLMAQRTISGTVLDADNNETLIGANVLATGTTVGTVTDFDGRFSLEVPSETESLTISYIGYDDVNVVLNDQTVYQIAMRQGSLLDEVLVIGYGTVKRSDATGSVQTVDSEVFNKGAITSPQELLAGKIAGVQISTNSGAPGEAATIRIRGGSSLSASNDPLIVIDGVPVDNGQINGGRNVLNIINPADIESFTVLKDASATAIYGSRASNGVIIITTKKGKAGQNFSAQLNAQFSSSKIINRVDVLDGNEFRSLINEQFEAGHPAVNLLGSENTDWQDQIYQSAFGQDYNLSFSGAFGNLPYRLSLGRTDKDGILKTDGFKRNTLAVNFSPGFLDNTLQVNAGIKLMRTNNRFADRGAIGNALAFDPTLPVLDSESPYGGYTTWTDINGNPNVLAPRNPLALLEQTTDVSEVNRFIGNVSIDYRLPFAKDVRATLNLAQDNTESSGTKDIPANSASSFDVATGGGVMNRYEQTKENSLLEFYLNYSKDLGNSNLDLMGGYSWQRFFFAENNFDSDLAGIETKEGDASGELFLLSLFGRANYSLQDKYLFTFTLRRDGSSRFSSENRWGLFPAAAFAYKIIDQDGPKLNRLKLRLGYGVTGQQDIGGYYEHLPRYLESFNNALYQFGDEFVTTLRPEGYDANIKWEETTTYNLGLDYGAFNDRVFGSIEYYIRYTADLLNFVPVAAGTNLTNFLNTNVGDLENRGIEFSLNTIPWQTGVNNWEIGFNVAANRNEITKLTASDDPDYVGVQVAGVGFGTNVQIHSVGYPANSFYVYEQVYDNNGKPIEGLFVDRNGDGIVSPEDLYRFKNPTPDFSFGFYTALNLGKLNLSAGARANLGNYIYNNIESDKANYSRLYHPTNYLSNALANVNDVGFNNPSTLSDHFVQDGSFFRVDHITASYELSEYVKKLSQLGVSLTVQNPLLITNYNGLDPEIGSGSRPGVDDNIYPRSRTILFGIQAGF